MKTFVRNCMLAFLVASIFFSCQKDDVVKDVSPISLPYLSFESMDELWSTALSVNAGKQVDTKKYVGENGAGFVSMKDIYNQAVAEEEEAFEREKKYLIPVSLKDLPSVKSNPSVFSFAEIGGIDLSIAMPQFATVINADGIVKVGASWLQFEGDKMKYIYDLPNREDEIALLKASKESNQKLKVTVEKITVKATPLPGGRTEEFDINRSCTNYKLASNGNQEYRMIVTENQFESGTYIPPGAGSPWRTNTIAVIFRTYQRGLFGSWGNRNSREQELSGVVGVTGDKSFWDCQSKASSIGSPDVIASTPAYWYDLNNFNGSLVSDWTVTILSVYGPSCVPGGVPPARNFRLTSNTYHNAHWRSYCTCQII